MAAIITALKIQKRKTNRVSIFLDGDYAFSAAANVVARLQVGQALEPEQVRALQKDAAIEDAYERALKQISRRPRSCKEIERFLSRKEYDPDVIESAVERLTAKKYLDDRAFAEVWVENRFEFRPRGVRALRAELYQKGLPGSLIETALEDYDEFNAALRAGTKAARRWQTSEEDEFQRRVRGYLTRRGFDYDLVRKIVARMWDEIAASSFESEGSE